MSGAPRRAVRGTTGPALILVALALSFPSARAADTTVYPTGTFPADVLAVRAAVRAGGHVVLKATDPAGIPTVFEFGPAVRGGANVGLTADVVIEGETLPGGAMTTIHGGSFVFIGGLGRPIVKTAIRGILFDGPRATALYADQFAGLEFSHNVVRNIVGYPAFPQRPDILKSQAVWVTTSFDYPYGQSGGVVIEDNVVENSLGNLSYGFAVYGVGTEVRVARNVVRNVNSCGVLVGINTALATIEDNVLIPGPGWDWGEGYFIGGAGIQAGDSFGGTFVVRNNVIRCENPLAEGIILLGTQYFLGTSLAGADVTGNHIALHGTPFGGVDAWGSVEGSRVEHNVITGRGGFAIMVSQYVPDDTTDLGVANCYRGNDIGHYSSASADLFFDVTSSQNIAVGPWSSAVDLGVDNRIVDTVIPRGALDRATRVRIDARSARLQSGLALERDAAARVSAELQ